MEMYLVRHYINALDDDDYGVSDNYCIVGLFSDKSKANEVRDELLDCIKSDEERESRELVDVIPIEVDKTYKGKDELWFGGACYIE